MLCAVDGCKNSTRTSNKDKKVTIRYFSFPEDPDLSRKWVEFCKRTGDFHTDNARICSDHFITKDFERNLKFEMGFTKKNILKLKPGVVPSMYKEVNIPSKSNQQVDSDKMENGDTAKQIEEYQQQIKKMQQENFRLRLNEKKLEKTIKNIQTQLTKGQYQYKYIETRLKTIFSDAQINKLKNEGKRVKWSKADITKALALYAAGKDAYIMLKREQFPLPAVRTLQRWTQKNDPKIIDFEIEEEIQSAGEEEDSSNNFAEELIKKGGSIDNVVKTCNYGDHSYFIYMDSA